MDEEQIDLDAMIRKDKFIHKKKRDSLQQRGRFGQDQKPRRHGPPANPYAQEPAIGVAVMGMKSNVSVQDILKLTQDKKVLSIRTQLKGKEGPIESAQNSELQVHIRFAKKDQANEFVNEFAEKAPQGMGPLTFQFRAY